VGYKAGEVKRAGPIELKVVNKFDGAYQMIMNAKAERSKY
jgi:hypothetical protein